MCMVLHQHTHGYGHGHGHSHGRKQNTPKLKKLTRLGSDVERLTGDEEEDEEQAKEEL